MRGQDFEVSGKSDSIQWAFVKQREMLMLTLPFIRIPHFLAGMGLTNDSRREKKGAKTGKRTSTFFRIRSTQKADEVKFGFSIEELEVRKTFTFLL